MQSSGQNVTLYILSNVKFGEISDHVKWSYDSQFFHVKTSYVKFHMLYESPSLRTSTRQYRVIVIAPPTDNRKSAIYDKNYPIYKKCTWSGLNMIYSNMTYNKCVYYSLVSDFNGYFCQNTPNKWFCLTNLKQPT